MDWYWIVLIGIACGTIGFTAGCLLAMIEGEEEK